MFLSAISKNDAIVLHIFWFIMNKKFTDNVKDDKIYGYLRKNLTRILFQVFCVQSKGETVHSAIRYY